MIRSNPVRRLAARSRAKEFPSVTEAHVAAADRLMMSWEIGRCTPAATANYSERQAGRATPGTLSAAVLHATHDYLEARNEVLRIEARLGALWPVIHAVVICAIDPTSWGEAQGMNADRAIGYVMAALDLLVRCYEPREERPSQIRAVEFQSVDSFKN